MKKGSLSLLLLTSFFLIHCSKEGPSGPIGPIGPEGPEGAIGAIGPQGNANVILYKFNGFVHSGTEVTKSFLLSEEDFNQSLLYTFVNYVTAGGSFWYPLPGYVTSSIEYRLLFGNLNTNSTTIAINRVRGTGTQEFVSMKIYAVRSNTIIDAGRGKENLGITTQEGKFYTDAELKKMSYNEFCKTLSIH